MVLFVRIKEGFGSKSNCGFFVGWMCVFLKINGNSFLAMAAVPHSSLSSLSVLVKYIFLQFLSSFLCPSFQTATVRVREHPKAHLFCCRRRFQCIHRVYFEVAKEIGGEKEQLHAGQ